jgi:hypothetical protein
LKINNLPPAWACGFLETEYYELIQLVSISIPGKSTWEPILHNIRKKKPNYTPECASAKVVHYVNKEEASSVRKELLGFFLCIFRSLPKYTMYWAAFQNI